jgi:hypothetical protein
VSVRWQRRGRRRWALERGQRWWSEPNAGDEGPRLNPLGFRQGAKQRQGGACQQGGQRSGRGACLTFASTSVWQLRRGVEGAAKKV